MPKVLISILLLFSFLTIDRGRCSEPEVDFDELSLEELLNRPVVVATRQAVQSRSAPGIITIISGEEIHNTGARDLIDVLRMIPGFFFGMDVQGVVGLGMRGNWGHEGKILLLIDGIEYNEPLFNSLQFGNHFDVSQIHKIEIIRGPGSVIYGGYAELAVINIITRPITADDEFLLNVWYGLMSDTYARRNLSLCWSETKANLGIKLAAFAGEGQRSQRDFTDFYGDSYNMKDNSRLDPKKIGLDLKYGFLSAHLSAEKYHVTNRDVFEENAPIPFNSDFTNHFMRFSYDQPVNARVNFQTALLYKNQVPWQCTNPEAKEYYAFYDINVKRYQQSSMLTYQLDNRFRLMIGQEITHDRSKPYNYSSDDDYFNVPRLEVDYTNLALLTQAGWQRAALNLSAGVRYDYHSQVDDALSPRVSVNYNPGIWTLKLAFNRAFRSPSIENLNYNPHIQPEKTTVYETGFGCQISQSMSLMVNAYQIKIDRPIVYFYDEELGDENYRNFDETGSSGFEAEFRFKRKSLYSVLTYSFYQANDQTVELYTIDQEPDRHLAFPAHKLTLTGWIDILDRLKVSPTLLFFSKRYGYNALDDADDRIINQYPQQLYANLFFSFQNLFDSKLDLGIGVYNLGNQTDYFIQPYDGWHAPLPGLSREFMARLTYNWSKG